MKLIGNSSSDKPNWKTLSAFYEAENQLAEHISSPLREDIKVTLKVSQNLHAAMKPYLLGALIGKEREAALEAGSRKSGAFWNG